MKLTANNVRTLPLPDDKKDHLEPDDDIPGFALRIREGGSRSLTFQYKVGKQQRRISLGAVSALDFREARKAALKLYSRVKLGEDPASDKADAKVRASETFAAIVPRFLQHQRARLRPRTYPDLERHLLKHAEALHGLQLAKIGRRDIAAILSTIAESSGDVTGNRARSSL
jgi:hypothetical protein